MNVQNQARNNGVNAQDYIEEERHLQCTRKLILREKDRLELAIMKAEELSEELKTEAWDSHLELKDSVNRADNAAVQQELIHLHQQITLYKHRVIELENMYRSPYFGRLDLLFEDETEVQSFYIGMRPLFDPDTFKSYILDWRTPVASLFYEADTGPTCYKSGRAHVKVNVISKKSYVIKQGKLIKVYDADNRIYDEYLQLVLSEGSSERMHDIVSTIQTEQNRVIRRSPDSSLLLTGVGGSGKTSIALHRLAYLLFRQPDLKADNCLMISPNEQFSDYVSDLLPVLADNMLNSDTYIHMIMNIIGNDIETIRQKSYIDGGQQRIQASASSEIIAVLDDFIRRFSRENLITDAIEIKGDVITPEEQRERLNRFAGIPHFQQSDILRDDLLVNRSHVFDHAAKKKFRAAMENRYRERDLIAIYRQFLADDKVRTALSEIAVPLTGRRLDRIDLTILAYIRQRLYKPKKMFAINQLVIDEFQDMTLLEHAVTASLFNGPVNLYGDLRQAIRFELPANYLEDVAEIYRIPAGDRIDLPIAYRSTKQITEFAADILHDNTIKAFYRSGEPVVEKTFTAVAGQVAAIREAIEHAVAAERRRIAVICENYRERKQLHREVNRRIYDEELKQFRKHHVFRIMTVDEAKGLEYDTVIVANRNSFDENTVQGRTRLYVACSRALHRLTVLRGENL